MKYYPMHMHLHTVHQPGASMESHIYNAHDFGMQYIHFTDHDTRTGPSKKTVNDFDFTRGVLEYETPAGVRCGFEIVGDTEAVFSDGEMKLSGVGRFGAHFFASGKKQSRALTSEVTVTLGMKHSFKAGSGIIIDVLLSQRPPDHKEAHLLYTIGEPRIPEYSHLAIIPIEEREDGIYRLEITRDVEPISEVGGLDNVFGTVSVIMTGEGEFSLTSLNIESIYGYNEVIERQRAVADKVGEKYGVKPFVTTEISGAGQHKNCYSTAVPVLDYRKGKITEAEAVAHVMSHGGIFSYNHPFESSKYKRVPFTREELDGIVKYETEKLIASRVLGASLMEVGFPLGRGLFTIEDHLTLWDNLSSAGVFITGYGDSDSHKSHTAWYRGNNFASWIGVDETIPFPVPEEAFTEAMVSGRVYMGDPVYLHGGVSLTSMGAEMGSVILGGGEYPVTLSIAEIPDGYTVRIIKSGSPITEDKTEGGRYEKTVYARASDKIEFIRAEAYNEEGRCIMLTNPIYIVSPDIGIEIPAERLVKA